MEMLTSPVPVFCVEDCMVVFMWAPLILRKAARKPPSDIYSRIQTGITAMRVVSFDFDGFLENENFWDKFTCVGRLIFPEGHVSSLNKSNPTNTCTRIGRLFREWKQLLRHIYLCRTANMSWRTCVVVKQIQSNQSFDFVYEISVYIKVFEMVIILIYSSIRICSYKNKWYSFRLFNAVRIPILHHYWFVI